MPDFIPGILLNEAFYWEAVRPILDAHLPGLPHAAASMGWGSDILGYDTPVSRDHGWGPRLTLFLQPDAFPTTAQAIGTLLRQNLPYTFRGYSTNYTEPDPEDNGTQVAKFIDQGEVNHQVYCQTLDAFWQDYLGVSPFQELEPADWLTFSEEQLLCVTAGKVFYDKLGLEAARQRFRYYPHEVWLYLLAAQWELIAQEEAFAGRTHQAGDELGSRVITGRMVERLMRLGFLMEKRYAPYSKWFGTAFKHLDCYARMGPLLEGTLNASTYPEREKYLAQAYTLAAEMHNALGITPPLETRTRMYSGWHNLRRGITEDDPNCSRPHQVIFAGRFVNAINQTIHDPQVLALLPNLGSTNTFLVESSDALQNTDFRRRLKDDLIK